MNERLNDVLKGRAGHYILPFFWQHGESAEELREGMARIADSGIREVCMESRPHPDFLGEKWWADLDTVMDEAKRRGMRVWVLDDEHFPSGMCAGRIADGSPYGKVYLTHSVTDVVGPLKNCAFMVRLDEGEELLGVVLGRADRARPDVLEDAVDLTDKVSDGKAYADIPDGTWSAMVLKTTRRGTGRRNYVNAIDREAVRFFIDTVYEPHFSRYGADFGGTFAGFFSDEPEIGNGASEHGHHLRAGQPDISLPWCGELEGMLRGAWGDGFALRLASLFAQVGGRAASAAARVRFTGAVADLYGRNFCSQIGDWCREHGAEYIGHVIEDDGRHAQLGLGTAHYFRALWGQDMAGIDVVLQQLRPQMDDFRFHTVGGIGTYNGEFFHYGLAKLGSSLAKLDPKKRGRTVCEVFGAYGWAEGLKQMKWILDHMLVNGVNRFVPHAFTMKPFPDPDCPPHFYARGNNPQYPYFRRLMEYADRVAHLISGGESRVSAAVLYTAEQEWAGDTVQFETAVKELSRAQIDCSVIPADCLAAAKIEGGAIALGSADRVSALVVCSSEWLPRDAADAVLRAAHAGVDVYVFGDTIPKIPNEDGSVGEIPQGTARLVPAGSLAQALRRDGHSEIRTAGEEKWLRYCHYARAEADYLLFFNEAAYDEVHTLVEIPALRGAVWYDPWENRAEPCRETDGSVRLDLSAYELKVLVLPRGEEALPCAPKAREGAGIEIPSTGWRVSLKPAGEEEFTPADVTELCDLNAPGRYPYFSGTARYERAFFWPEGAPRSAVLTLGEVYETAQVFVNGAEAGVRVAPPYSFRIEGALVPGENRIEILAVNTLVHRMRDFLSMTMPMEPGGLIGPVRIAATDEAQADA